ncbi:hypothetical protein G3446_06415 [Thiorhodococcus minor]|uniref:DUF429 domain-containing protein n=2 Tax=Thiorhodococcus minor TaxID=57489 RepID=A0A6M0JYS6_9GAMM|nr:hypothetical protein [Thiorhodococcus minor]
MTGAAAFERYVGIDYSGAETPTSSLKGLRVYVAQQGIAPSELPPPPSPRKYWTRRGIAEWLLELLAEPAPTLVGIDHAFSFPIRYFETHHLEPDWSSFLKDFRTHWPTDGDNIDVDCVRDGFAGDGAARMGSAKWRRVTETLCKAKSVFHFDVPGSVAKSTHAGLPWLLLLREQLGSQLHFWPFDGWAIPRGHSAIAEVYPSLWSKALPREDRTPDQHDAYAVTAMLERLDRSGDIAKLWEPALTPQERAVAQVEGWILGVMPTTGGSR